MTEEQLKQLELEKTRLRLLIRDMVKAGADYHDIELAVMDGIKEANGDSLYCDIHS